MPEPKTLWAFPGLHYFEDTEVDQQLFFGRTREIQELTGRILAENITILFGKSGDGKTSLINAGIKPRFRELGFLPVRARIFNAPKETSLFQLLYQAVADEAAEQQIELPPQWPAETLWESFYHLQPTETNALKPILLILDQFEELFTLFANRTAEQDAFIEQFADLVRGRIPAPVRERLREQLPTLTPGAPEFIHLEKLLYGNPPPPIKILVSLREDYLAYLDNLGQKIPKVYDSRYRLPALSLAQAREAIENPPAQAVLEDNQFQIEKEAVTALLEFLKMSTSRSGVLEEVVGPPQLQVICRQLEKGMREQGKNVIQVADLGGENGLRRLLTQYYQDITQTIPRLRLGAGPRKSSGPLNLLRRLLPVHFPRTAVHHLCEDRLITAGGNRNTRHEDEIIHEIGVAKGDLEHLVDSRLLRREPRLNEAFYELSHDSLVPSLQTTGKFRKNMAAAIKLLVVGLLIFTVVYWGIPYFQSTYTIYKLDQSLDLMKKQKVSIFDFRLELYRAKNRVQDSGQLGRYLEELKNCFYAQKAPDFQRADSLIETINWIYPREDSLIKALKDSLREQRFQYVKSRYLQLVAGDSVNWQPVSNFLDSAYLALNKDNRILEMQIYFAKRQKNKAAEQLAQELLRQNQIYMEQLRAAIQLRELPALQIEYTPVLEIVLENHHLLENTKVFMNEQEMIFKKSGKERLRSASLRIPIGVNEIKVKIRVVDNQKIEVTKEYKFFIRLRWTPTTLSYEQAIAMLKQYDFFDAYKNEKGKGFANRFKSMTLSGEKVVLDEATGLMWQQGGSPNYMIRKDAEDYVRERNREKLAGFDDWRLPTLEEAMSLMEPKQLNGDLYIDLLFDGKQRWIWTADAVEGASRWWVVLFYNGNCFEDNYIGNINYVRLVRSGQSLSGR